MENEKEMISAYQTSEGYWLPRIGTDLIGDCPAHDTRKECLDWARKFFGPAFKYSDEE